MVQKMVERVYNIEDAEDAEDVRMCLLFGLFLLTINICDLRKHWSPEQEERERAFMNVFVSRLLACKNITFMS
jgi:hypothetical protein